MTFYAYLPHINSEPEGDINESHSYVSVCALNVSANINALSFQVYRPFFISIWNMNTCVRHIIQSTKEVNCKMIQSCKVKWSHKMRIVEWSFKIENGNIYKWIHTHSWLCVLWCENAIADEQDSNFYSIVYTCFRKLILFFLFFISYSPFTCTMCMCNVASSQFHWLLGTFKAVQFIWFEVLTYSLNHFIHSLCVVFRSIFLQNTHTQ